MQTTQLYTNAATSLVDNIIGQIEPLVGAPIPDATRQAIAADLVASLQRNMPPLANLQAAAG